MKKLNIIVVCLLCLFVGAPAFADYYGGIVNYSRISGYYSGNGGEFTLRSYGDPGLLLSNSAYDPKTRGQDGNAESFQTFCVECSEFVAQPMDIMVSTTSAEGISNSHAILGGKATGDDLDPRTAYLYTQFATGVLSSYNYAVNRSYWAGELQEAIWYIEEEIGSASGQAANWVLEAENAISAGTWSGIGDVRILNTWKPGHIGVDDCKYRCQDQLYLVPVPGAVLLGLLGLGAAGLKLRKFA